MKGLNPQKRGRKETLKDQSAERIAQLENENQRLKGRLRKAEIIIEAQKKSRRSWASSRIWKSEDRRRQLMQAADTLSRKVGKESAFHVMGLCRASFYRHHSPVVRPPAERKAPPLALSQSERQVVFEELHGERFQDKAPLEVYATLIDEGRYLCSPRTMYRILAAEHGSVKERRQQVERPPLQQAGTSGHRAKSALELGNNQAQGAGQVDVLLSKRDHRCLQPLCCGLDVCPSRTKDSCQASD